MTRINYTTSFLLVHAIVLLASPARAATITWDGSGISTNWNAANGSNTNWDGSVIPGAGDDVVFPDTAANFIVNLNGDRTVTSATFSGVENYFLNNNTLTLSSGNITSTGSGIHVINSNVALGAAGVWDIGSGGSLTVNGVVSGSVQLTKTGDGPLLLSGNNTYTGTTRIEAGALAATGGDAIPDTSAVAVLSDAIFAVNGTERIAGLLNFSGSVLLGDTATLELQQTITRFFPGTITGDSSTSLVKLGVANQRLDAANPDFFGTTTINGGKIILNDPNALQNSTININVNNGLNVTTNNIDATLGGLTANANLDISSQTLTVQSTTTVNSGATVSVGTGTLRAMDDVSISGGTIDVDGGSLDASGLTDQAGNSMTLSGNATVTLKGTINLKGGNGNGIFDDGGNGGNLNIEGGTFTMDSAAATLDLTGGVGGEFGLPGAAGVVHVSGGTLTLNAGLIKGSNATPSADPVNLIGTDINITNTGSVNIDGNMTIDGGSLNRDTTGVFNLGSGLTLTAKNNAQIDFTNNYQIDDGTTFNLQNGADLIVSRFLDIGVSGNGTLLVDGTGSSVTAGDLSLWGSGGSAADVTFRNGATGNLAEIDLARGTTNGSTGIINIESGATVTTKRLRLTTIGGGTTSGTITVDGATTSLTQNGSSTLAVGKSTGGTATINVQNNGTFTTGTGTTTVNATGTVNVGVVGSGTFNANGNVNVDGGTIMRGSDSNSFNLASGLTLTAKNDAQIHFDNIYNLDQGTTFDIQSGADFSTTGSLHIGFGGGDGTLVVDGAGSSVTTGAASSSIWGDGETADVTFRNGATGDLGGIRLANSPAAGSTAIFNIESGAAVTTSGMSVSNFGTANTSGTITVDGATSSLTQNGSSALAVGKPTGGTATINVQNGGTFATGTGITDVRTTGTINVGAIGSGTFNANGSMFIFGTVNLIEGQMSAGMVTLNSGGAFNFTGGTLAVDTFAGDLTQDGGTLAPGASPGITNITSNYVMNAGTLAIELGGLLAGSQFDQLVVTGDATIGGTLDVSLFAPFTPSFGQSFEIVNVAGSLTGTFSGLSQGALVGNFGGTDLFINYAAGDGNDISLVATQAGDFDFDFNVDGFDFLKWQRGFGSSYDANDLADWETNFGSVAPLVAASAAVPEPTSLALLSLGGLLSLCRFRHAFPFTA